MPNKMTLGGLLGGFLVPGLAVYLRGPRLWGKAALTACALLFLFFIVWLGYPFGNYAFGMMLSIHTTGFVYYCSPWLINEPFRSRIFLTIGLMLALGLVIYWPLRSAIQNHWLMPLRVNGHVIVVQRLVSTRTVRRGDWIAYKLSRSSDDDAFGYAEDTRIYVHSGIGFGPLLAAGSDRVEFSTNSFAVNGISQPLLPHMPISGMVTVPENQWFIWPNLGISGHGNVGAVNISAIMLRMATVPENQFIGKPFKRWFWRKQILQ